MPADEVRRRLLLFASDNAAWLAPGTMFLSIVASEGIRSAIGVSPPAVVLFSTVLMLSSLAGVRVGLTSAALLCAYLLYLTLIGAGPPVVTGNFLQLLLTSLAILVIAFGFGYAMDGNRALIEDFEKTDAELKQSRDELERRVTEAATKLRLGEAERVAQLGSFEREVVAISERERNRIGRDLHDGLGQELTGISLALRTLSQQLVREGSPHVDQVKTITHMVQNTISEARGFARRLAPEILVEQGLCSALRALASEIDEMSSASCSAFNHYQGKISDPEVATHFYRIAQEGVSNALKHGSAENIELHFGRDGDSLYIEIFDDGVGISAGDDYSEGMGIRSMRFRAQLLQGKLDVGPGPDGGTRVRCACPYQFQRAPG